MIIKNVMPRYTLVKSITVLLTALTLSACSDGHSAPNVGTPVSVSADNEPPFNRPARPGSFLVNSEGDEPDALRGDGRCESAKGECTLRAAVQESNALVMQTTSPLTRTNVIIVPEGHYRFIESPVVATAAGVTLDAGRLVILGNTNIRGAGARRTIIDGNNIDRVFEVSANSTFTISDVTITGATASGIYNHGQLIVTRCLITENYSGYGAGIFNTPWSSAIIDSSTISNNTAESEGAGIRFDSAGLVINSTISGNRILESCCDDTTYDGGTQGEGGGIDARNGSAVTIMNSTIVNNHAVIGGGGVNIAKSYQGDPDDLVETYSNGTQGHPLELINTIIAGNTSTRGRANCSQVISPIYSLGGNVSDDDSCELNAENDLPNTDPKIKALANNGGPTDTHGLAIDSPARRNALQENCSPQDQTGAERLRPCDTGAVNSSGTAP
ncbi:hypothetical protein HNQ57_003478 [Zhongshania antarctica]|uniref:Right handed beta helix domain-containing protein n=1 Tax=Zhongshania antarctica TaxID=641702 RepID=A0A840R7E8_9GAMM|nr:right-handed parallel beta-helix repeat-containing protein [Zhongshania antarctica]MBB5189175.1 hypothetical protein [Zhongshania antarctica]